MDEKNLAKKKRFFFLSRALRIFLTYELCFYVGNLNLRQQIEGRNCDQGLFFSLLVLLGRGDVFSLRGGQQARSPRIKMVKIE